MFESRSRMMNPVAVSLVSVARFVNQLSDKMRWLHFKSGTDSVTACIQTPKSLTYTKFVICGMPLLFPKSS